MSTLGEAQAISGKPWTSKPMRAIKPDAQGFDEIRIITVPRYKTSDLSGDEWRISSIIQFWRKGKMVHEVRGGRNIETSVIMLGHAYLSALDDGKGFFAGENETCDQEGCSNPATVTYRKKADFGRDGHKTETHGIQLRKFCDEHKTRGDCGLDDADENYEPYADE